MARYNELLFEGFAFASDMFFLGFAYNINQAVRHVRGAACRTTNIIGYPN